MPEVVANKNVGGRGSAILRVEAYEWELEMTKICGKEKNGETKL